VREDLRTRPDVLHGGVFMALADTLGAVATEAGLPEGAQTVTIESKTNFLRPAPVRTKVIAECTPLHRGPPHAGLADAELHYRCVSLSTVLSRRPASANPRPGRRR
jgi:uncharacterized protein (TIGR00369 family)